MTRKRRLSLTSLIDVIFLLLLFFMLSSTFSRFAEVELSAASVGRAGVSDTKPSFLQVSPEALHINGQDIALDALPGTFADLSPDADTLPLIVSLQDDVTAQRLTDILVVLRSIDRLNIRVLGS